MRWLTALKADLFFQFKQGFYYIYAILSLIYLIIFSQISDSVLQFVLPIVMFTDPSVLGLFFIGGLLLLEKEQGILSLTYITPLKIYEFVMSKVISLILISLLAVIVISLVSYNGSVNYLSLISGIILTSIIFTLYGFLIASKAKSINDYFVKMIPQMILLIIPCILIFIFPNWWFLNIAPSVSALNLVWGAYHGIGYPQLGINITYLTLISFIMYRYTIKAFIKGMIVTD